MKTEISKYNMGWLQLTVSVGHSTSTLSRKLRDLGWIKVHPGVWMRPCVRVNEQAKYIEAIKPYAPYASNLHFLFVTDAQWVNSVTVIGQNYPTAVAA
jgi:CRISPR/Cas system-associated protein endoribonuclease Cas2